MKDIHLTIAKELNKMAKELIADDYKYIYDPDHKKHPGGGYVKTEKGWQKGKQDKEQEKNENDKVDEKKSQWQVKVQKISSETKEKIAKDKQCPSKILDFLAKDEDNHVRFLVAGNQNTSTETLDKLANEKNYQIRWEVAENPNTSAKTLSKLSEDENEGVYQAVAYNKNASPETLEYIYDRIDEKYVGTNNEVYAIQAIAKHKNTKSDTLDQIAQKWKQGTELGDAARENLKKRGAYEPSIYGDTLPQESQTKKTDKKLPKFKFKGDDKTQAIIRKKFEKDQDEEETNTIYGEMAKFSRDDVAPMGVYHGRTKDQLKADFIKNMDPSNYASPESFKKAQERIKKMSATDFSKILASIFADEDEEV